MSYTKAAISEVGPLLWITCRDFFSLRLPLGIKKALSDEAKSADTSTDEPRLFLHAGLIFLPRLTLARVFADDASVTNLDDIQEW